MKKRLNFILIILCLLTVLCVAFASCVDDADPDTDKITVTVNLNLDGVNTQTFTIEQNTEFYSKLASYIPADTNGLVFAGWLDSSGKEVNAETRWDKNGTVNAQWNVAYVTEYYLETDSGFVKSDEYTTSGSGKLGATVSAEQIQITGYTFDVSNENNVQSVTLSAGAALKLYYKRIVYTITFNKNYADATGTMTVLMCPHGSSVNLTANGFECKYPFGAWNTQANGTGSDSYADGAAITVTSDITLYAQWVVSFTEQVYVERLVDGEYKYVLNQTESRQGYLGNGAFIQTTYEGEHYFPDYNHKDGNPDVQNLYDGAVLSVYYSLDRYTLIYADDNLEVILRYGEQYTVRDPEQSTIISYSSSAAGYGKEYNFGDVITLEDNLTLYPVLVEVFTDADGSGDFVEIRSEYTGLGSARLVKNGVRYLGFVNYQSESLITFDVTVSQGDQDSGVTYHGKLLSDGTFIYRSEDEQGTYLLYDPLFPEYGVSPYTMLALDGYGTGVLSDYMDDGSGRSQNYYVSYSKTEDGDYFMRYYLPAMPEDVHEGYFQIVRGSIDGSDDLGVEIAGYFMLCGVEYGGAVLVYNGEAYSNYVLVLDGYGKGSYCYVVNDQIDTQIDGIYVASKNYTSDAPEYVFYPDNTALLETFSFVLFSQQNPNTGEYAVFFIQQHDEYGAYTQTTESGYPELYLDGYGGAKYFASENDDGMLGSYVIDSVDGGYEVLVTFFGDDEGTLRVSLNKSNNTFTVLDNQFRTEQDGTVLTEYFGTASVIIVPNGVKEIAADVFNSYAAGKNITSITLPDSIETIGARAFENNYILKALYVSSTTPPVLGEGALRWPRSDFMIVVPDGYEDVYREADGWKDYAQYITSNYELAHKPPFEIKGTVLVSYNPTEEMISSGVVVIPDEVTEIANGVFAHREYIKSVNLNNVTVIGANAFDGCINLSAVTFNENTVSIGNEAFFGCVKLAEVELYNVQTIGDGAFNCCYDLTKVHIGGKITSIGTLAFARCALVMGDGDEEIAQNELIVTLDATKAPLMAQKVFLASIPRIYVSSYDVGVNFAEDEDANWAMYVTYLRVKSQSDALTLYSMANMGNLLVLDDRAIFGEGALTGLYKWQDDMLYVTWFNRDPMTTTLSVIRQAAIYDAALGGYRGLKLDDDNLVFITKGTEVSYSNGNESLTVKFGTDEAAFNGNAVTMQIVNYRMQFVYQGYLYELSLAINETFTYKRTLVETTKTYTAADGSSVTVTLGETSSAIGTIKNVDGSGLAITVQYDRWYLTLEQDGTYTFIIQRYNPSTQANVAYHIAMTLNDNDDTFTYTSQIYYIRETYRNDSDDYIVVTSYADGRLTMIFNFKTANGELSCNVNNVQAVDGEENAYLVTIDIMIDVVDDDGNVTGQIPSEFNGEYKVILNLTNKTYTLTRV